MDNLAPIDNNEDVPTKIFVDGHPWQFAPGATETATDMNLLTNTGLYEVMASAANRPPVTPSSAWGHVVVIREEYAASWVSQLWQTQGQSGEMWVRGRSSAGWGAWTLLPSKTYVDDKIAIDPAQPTAPQAELWVDTDENPTTYLDQTAADARYINAAGDTMPGEFILQSRMISDNVALGGDLSSTGIEIRRSTYPELRMTKQANTVAGVAMDWRLYISGTDTDTTPALSLFARDSTGTHTKTTFRFYGQPGAGGGIFQIESDSAEAKGWVPPVGAVMKLRDGTTGDDRGIGLRDNTDQGHSAGVGLTAIQYPAGTPAPITAMDPNSAQHVVTKNYLENRTSSSMANSGTWVMSTNYLYKQGGWVFLTIGTSKSTAQTGAGEVIATLPVGYRPPFQVSFSAWGGAVSGSGGRRMWIFAANTNGTITLPSGTSMSPANESMAGTVAFPAA